MRQANLPWEDAALLDEGDTHDVEVPLRRWNAEPASEAREAAKETKPSAIPPGRAASASHPFSHLTMALQRLRLLCHHYCPSCVLSGGSTVAGGASDVSQRCCSAVRSMQTLCLLIPVVFMNLWNPSSAGSRMPQRRVVSLSGYRRRAALCLLVSVVLVFLLTLFFVTWAGLTLAMDPYAEMRIRLSVAYPRETVEQVVAVMQSRASAQLPEEETALYDPILHVTYKAVVRVRVRTEALMLSVLSHLLAITSRDAQETARKWMGQLWVDLKSPIPDMLGEHRAISNTKKLNRSDIGAGLLVRATVGQRMLPVTRAAEMRCTHGVPTLPALVEQTSEELPGTEAIFDSLWSAFARANAVTAALPKCLARSQHRMPCADVGVSSNASSRVQHLYEHSRLHVRGDALAELYYDYTPSLPAEALEWRDALWDGTEEEAEDVDELEARVRAQAARFRRTTATPLEGTSTAVSGVILFLAGAGNRNPKGRDDVFTQHALPLLEKNLLRTYPHYPVHIFYEAAAAPSLPDKPTPAWSLTDVLRHSDVYTILHAWDLANATRVDSGNQRVHVPPPPPVMVDSLDRLPPMRAQQEQMISWFDAVASCVPSAPYVTFENIAPLFSTLPCGVTEDDVTTWIKNKRVFRGHHRGYRQMCRFWARLVWRLPSLRVWTDSPGGRSELAMYAEDATTRTTVFTATTLPPWRYRYAYYMRLDTDSFLHRPVVCDPFALMAAQRCAYGYNLLREDVPRVVINLGSAMAEWMDNRTSITNSERALASVNASRDVDEIGDWGLLNDPSLSSMVTLMPPREWEDVQMPPLPPTWPWFNVYPEHSSAAVSAAERDVLRAYFFTSVGGARGDWKDPPNIDVLNASKKKAMLAERLPSDYARADTYNLQIYFNNFELGTFALKNHPLYTSVTEFFDNRDFDDVPGPEREAAGVNFTLVELEVGGAAGVAARQMANAQVYSGPVYLLQASAGTRGRDRRTTASTQCRGRGRVSGDDVKLDKRKGSHSARARDDTRDWRSGYLQYRWGDAPVHTFGVEAVMQREGWGVCAFANDFGLYVHGKFRPRKEE